MKELFIISLCLLWIPIIYLGVDWKPETWLGGKFFDFIFLTTVGVLVSVIINYFTNISKRFTWLEKFYQLDKGKEAFDEKDYARAIKIWKPLAEGGYADAQLHLGLAYQDGKGVEKSYEEALKWYQKAAKQNNTEAQNNIGWIYEKGKGVKKNYKEALKWYQKAAKQNNTEAQHNIGSLYERGKGVKKNYKEALKWYYQAAKQGNTISQIKIGSMYQDGVEVEESIIFAHMWFSIAIINGNKNAEEWLSETKELLSEEEIEDAEKMAEQCIESGYKKHFDGFENE